MIGVGSSPSKTTMHYSIGGPGLIAQELTHWGRDNMAAISQTTFSNAFSWMKNAWISLKISLKFVPNVRIDNIPALVQIMAWRRPGEKPLSEPMMVSLLMHICVTRPQWVNSNFEEVWLNQSGLHSFSIKSMKLIFHGLQKNTTSLQSIPIHVKTTTSLTLHIRDKLYGCNSDAKKK